MKLSLLYLFCLWHDDVNGQYEFVTIDLEFTSDGVQIKFVKFVSYIWKLV